ncbi:MAG: hypothetical protein C0472_14555 [Erythrobacter sp.]|nr:hypothetical protein [Erythrobacter sp.]MBA4172360.1 hypothetical protein [Hyphomicrobium sp.]
MNASADFLSVQFIGNVDETLQTSLVTLAPPSLNAPTGGESEEAFEDRRTRFAALVKARTDVLRRFSQTVPLIPRLIAASQARSGTASFAQMLPAAADDPEVGREGLLRVAADLAEGLGALHAAGECHLGILPELLRYDGTRTYLCGIGADLRALLPASFSHADLGDPGFFPPELFDSSMQSKVGPWSDVYQMSATLYRLAIGHQPPSLMERMVDPAGTLARIRAELEGAPAVAGTGLAEAIAAGLNVSRANRPQDATAWASGIDFTPLSALRASDRQEIAPVVAEPDPLEAVETDSEAVPEEAPLAPAVAESEPEPEPVAAERSFRGDRLRDLAPQESAPARSRFGPGCALLSFLALIVLSGAIAAALYMSGMLDPRPAAIASASPEEPVETPTNEPLPPEPTPTAEPEPALPQVAWLLGTWAVNQDQTGCTKKLRIAEGNKPYTLIFSNPGADLKQEDTFEQDEPDSLTTSAWTYVREDGFIRMVGVGRNAGLTATLSKCAVPVEAEAAP